MLEFLTVLLGYPISELLASILVLLSISEREPSQSEIFHILGNPQSDAYRTTAVIWNWVVERKDISVGNERKYNGYSLSRILSLGPKSPVVDASAAAPPSETNAQEREGLRIYVSENTMWESLTGHGVDHKRIPRSEWILLQGIASTACKGILQGDLGRLVGQDKRSVPKRTSCLVEKGYITKRTTLVRGTKTSKLWLKFLAPSTPEETSEGNETETEITLSRQFLVDSLEPVPWHTRWTGDSIDYKVLATTVMAICKEWNVMRLQDLKSKLGVLGMTWQMKVVSKICRFLNARGTIRYVAAKLNHRIFKDCIRFNREMSARDWSIFLATGKRTTKSSKLSTQENGEDEIITSVALRGVPGFGESHCPLWSIYTPITSLVGLCIEEAGPDGLTNPQLCAMTIGPSFTRYLAGVTAAISTDNIQPTNVRHLTVKSERGRPGKSSSLYWYSMVDLETQERNLPQRTTHQSKPRRKQDSSSFPEPYGFTSLALGNFNPAQASALRSTLSATLSELCQRGLSQQKRRGRPKKIRPEQQTGSHDLLPRESTVVRDTPTEGAREAAARSVVIEEERNTVPNHQMVETEPPEDTVGLDILDERPGYQIPEPAMRVRGRPRIRDGGQSGRKAPSNRQFRCEKCSGTWKNDVGLKYHLEKSQTTCNPSFKPQIMPAAKRKPQSAKTGRRVLQEKGRVVETNSDYTSHLSAGNSSFRLEPVGRSSTNCKARGMRGLATPSARKQLHQAPVALTVEEDMSILSGQAELLTAISALPPRQVDPFAKPSVRQLAVQIHVTGILKDSEASTRLPELQKTISEVPEARAAGIDGLQDFAAAADGVKDTPKRLQLKITIRHKLMNIITELLHQYSGALPAGKPLEILVCEKWQSQHYGEDTPSGARIRSVMLQMIREREIVDQWHAFKASDGRIGKCQIITTPSLMAFAPETRTLVEAIRQLYPEIILPHQLPGLSRVSEDTGNFKEEALEIHATRRNRHDNKVGGRGRRSLAAGVAILSAPVYAAQIATKRAGECDETSKFPGKRRRIAEEALPLVDEQQRDHFWPVADTPPPPNSHTIKQLPPSSYAGVTLDILLDDAFKNGHALDYVNIPLWARSGVTGCFEELAETMQQEGWIAGSAWYSWASHNHLPSQASMDPHTDRSQLDYFVEKLKVCLKIEMENEDIIHIPAQARSVFVNFLGGDAGKYLQMPRVQWHEPEKRPSTADRDPIKADGDESSLGSTSADEELEPPSIAVQMSSMPNSTGTYQSASTPIKRVTLTSRSLTSLPLDLDEQRAVAEQLADADGNELVAAFVVIRSLLGGVDKVIDWGLLAHLFPTVGLPSLRRFWARIRKEKASFLSKATHDFQESLVAAIQADEIAIPDYERPLEYDWEGLIRWAMRHPNQEQLQLPRSREKFHQEFKLEEDVKNGEDWKEKFYHPQSSVYSRFEAVTLQPGSLTITEVTRQSEVQPTLGTVDIARSWIRSLCCTSETEYTPQDVKERFSILSQETSQRNNVVLKTAIEQLTRERVICKSKRAPFGGRPYRLHEGYTSILGKVAHRQKYLDAAAFKNDLDKAFQSSRTMRVPYTLSDGAMMALTNLIANERIRITATTVPNIPFGFEPGNYESRKYPKSYYHLNLDIQPTQSYLLNEDIDILQVAQRVGPPRDGQTREIPQWVDFFGKLDEQRWSDILGAVCFAFNTRGVMSVKGMCDAIAPILDVFEAQLIISWGLETGVFARATQTSNLTLGEWWWLVAQRP